MMLKHLFASLLLLSFAMAAKAQEAEAYRLFEQGGKSSSYKKMLKEAAEADVVLFGEIHNNSINHWLQLRLLKDLHALKQTKLAVGAEMFEADDQIAIDEYFGGFIQEKNFLAESKLWDNYATDYRPVLEFARAGGLKFVATNVPRRYANLVYRRGMPALDSLSGPAKAWMPFLPLDVNYELPSYKNMMGMMPGHAGKNLVAAQALKDASMSYFILQNLPEGGSFYHINGTYHSDNFEGIGYYLKKAKPGLRVFVIASVEQTETEKLESKNEGLGHFILCIPSDMSKSY